MGVAVDKHVDAGDVLQQVDGAVAGRLCVNAQVAQADDVVAASGGELVHLLLGAGEEFVLGQEGDAIQVSRVSLGGSFGGGQTKNAHGHVTQLEGGAGAVYCIGAVLFSVGGQDGEVSLLHQSLQIGISEVKLVVAGGGHVIASHVHEFHSGSALGLIHIQAALTKVAGVHQEHFGSGSFIGGLQRGYVAVVLQGIVVHGAANAVHVVGVQDDDVPRQVIVPVCGPGGNGQGEGHHQRQEEGGKFLPTFHFEQSSNITNFPSSRGGHPGYGGCL